MDLYIYPSSTEDNTVRNLRKNILDSLSNNATTWLLLDRRIDIGNDITLPLFTHIENQYQNEPFYFRVSVDSVLLKFEINQNEGSKSMIIGMLVYYLRYHLSDQIRKIELI